MSNGNERSALQAATDLQIAKAALPSSIGGCQGDDTGLCFKAGVRWRERTLGIGIDEAVRHPAATPAGADAAKDMTCRDCRDHSPTCCSSVLGYWLCITCMSRRLLALVDREKLNQLAADEAIESAGPERAAPPLTLDEFERRRAAFWADYKRRADEMWGEYVAQAEGAASQPARQGDLDSALERVEAWIDPETRTAPLQPEDVRAVTDAARQVAGGQR